jgi:hypothetical protein
MGTEAKSSLPLEKFEVFSKTSHGPFIGLLWQFHRPSLSSALFAENHCFSKIITFSLMIFWMNHGERLLQTWCYNRTKVEEFFNDFFLYRRPVSMSKQVMNLNVLAEFIANTFGTSKVLVDRNNSVLTIEPVSTTNKDVLINNHGQYTNNHERIVDHTKAGTLKFVDFSGIKMSTKNFKF